MTALALALSGLLLFAWHLAPDISSAMRLALPDSDDSLRLASIRDFLAGQSWFDMTQYRYLPPAGVELHWSRIVELPVVGAILGLTPVIGHELAEKLAVTGWPLALFLVYAGIVGWGAARLFGLRAAGLAVFVAAQMIVFRDLFAPGRIDHHNVEAILMALAAIGFGLSGRQPRMALLSGAAAGLSLAIVLETIPFVAVIGLAFVLHWVVRGARAVPALAWFGASFAVAALAGFALRTAPSQWPVAACDTLSAPWLVVAVGEGAVALALASLGGRFPKRGSRLAVAAVAGTVPPALFAMLYPQCLGGFYEALPEPYRSQLLAATVEAFPFWRFVAINPIPAFQAVPPLLVGALAASFGAVRGSDTTRPSLMLLAALLWLGVVGAQFQIRIVYIASAFLPLVAGWLLEWLLAADAGKRAAAVRVVSLGGFVLLFGIVWALVGSAAQSVAASRFDPAPVTEPCADPRSVAPLDALPAGLVLGQINLGPAVLLHTHHSIVVAGYHRATEGVIAGFRAFAGSEQDMREQVQKYRVDYVALCQSWLPPPDKARPFARELTDGRRVAWLQPIDLGGGPLKVWRVAKDR